MNDLSSGAEDCYQFRVDSVNLGGLDCCYLMWSIDCSEKYLIGYHESPWLRCAEMMADGDVGGDGGRRRDSYC
jgi:hypothetical protein